MPPLLGAPIALPDPSCNRWTPARKAAIVHAIAHKQLTTEQALQRYAISEEELHGWIRMLYRHGLGGVMTTKTQLYRRPETATTGS